MTQPMRSLFDRMTNPTPEELDTKARIQMLGRHEVTRMIDHIIMALEHLASQRDDLHVQRTQHDNTWTIQVELKPIVPSQVVVPGV